MEKKSEQVVISMDVGTSSLKGGVIDAEGKLINWVRVPLNEKTAGPLETQPAETWLKAMGTALSKLPERRRAAALAVSGNGPTVVPVDASGKALDEASLWLNRRDVRVEGQPSFFLPKIAWFARHKPDIYAGARWFLGCPEYLAFVLCGEAAAFTPSEEFTPYIWGKKGIEAYQLDQRKVPQPVRTGMVLGTLRRDAAATPGLQAVADLPPDIPVIAAGADFLMALVGTAVTGPGRTCDRAGTSEGINCCMDRRIIHPQLRCLPHAVDGMYNIAGILASTGRIFEWFRRFSGQQDRDYYQMLSDIVKVKWDRQLPHFYPSLHRGEVWEFSRGIFTDLEAHHGSAEMGRAVVSSIGFGVRDLIETLEEQGCEIGSLRISGGQGRNTIWNQMKADIIGRVIEVPHIIDAELAGNAVAAFTALGCYPSLTDAAEKMVRIDMQFEPVMDRYESYTEEYLDYEQHCERIMAALS